MAEIAASALFDEFVDYVRENYSRARKIVEVGVGHRIDVAERIKKALPLAEVLVTDNNESSLRQHPRGKVRTVADDVMAPKASIYEDSLLIYSINPPVEIVDAMTQLARTVGADLVIVPRSDEQDAFHHDDWQKLIRNGRTVGWLRVFDRQSARAKIVEGPSPSVLKTRSQAEVLPKPARTNLTS
ncbi:MAG TPA: UPF0146 family protein [Candidatus Dormibacteraeota bacterium]|nr:UPF0146 family protein [Candidatus Dormibacteraeota bacterium]